MNSKHFCKESQFCIVLMVSDLDIFCEYCLIRNPKAPNLSDKLHFEITESSI